MVAKRKDADKPRQIGIRGGKLSSPMGRKAQESFNQGDRREYGIPIEKWKQMTSEEKSAHKRSLGYEDSDDTSAERRGTVIAGKREMPR